MLCKMWEGNEASLSSLKLDALSFSSQCHLYYTNKNIYVYIYTHRSTLANYKCTLHQVTSPSH